MIKILPGTYTSAELPNAVYHADRDNISSGWINTLVTQDKTLAHLYHQLYVEQRKDSIAMLEGRLIHVALLEPDILTESYLTLDREVEFLNKNSKLYKEARGEMLELCRDRGAELVTCEQMDMAKSIRLQAEKSHMFRTIFKSCITEQTLVYQDHELLTSKLRADIVSNDSVILDIKKTVSASPKNFKKSIANFGYDVSAAHYQTGAAQEWDIEHFGWIAIEAEPPYLMAFYQADEELLQTGYAKRDKAMAMLEYSMTKDGERIPGQTPDVTRWPGFPDEFKMISLPSYAVVDSNLNH